MTFALRCACAVVATHGLHPQVAPTVTAMQGLHVPSLPRTHRECARTHAQNLCGCVCVRALAREHKSRNKGLISADRRTKPTLMLTIPRSYQVVYKRFINLDVWNYFSAHPPRFRARGTTRNYMVLGRSLSLLRSHRDQWASSLFSMDSDLEAFSHNPADDSVGALPFQATP